MWFLELINNFLNITSDRMSVGTLSMASIGFVFNNKLISMNLFRLLQFESYQCGSLAAIR